MSNTLCAEQFQRFHSSQQKSHHLHNIDVPPRKLLSRRGSARTTSFNSDSAMSPKAGVAEEALFRKFLPYNSGFDDDEDDPYAADHFRMFEFKIRRCTRSRSHDWTDCPFAHPGEKARRRDPRRFSYSGAVCPEFRRGSCSKGDACEFAHGVFECWLHPARYRTEACKDGKNCKRKVCFFAHTPKQLRVLSANGSPEDSPVSRKGSRNPNNPSSAYSGCNHCCVFCLHHHNNNPNSPTSTLLSFSPPRSPVKNRPSSSVDSFSPISRLGGGIQNNNHKHSNSLLSYDEALAELVASLDAMDIVEDDGHGPGQFSDSSYYPWVDQSGLNGENEIFSTVNHQQQPTQFILSPSSPERNYFNNSNFSGSGSWPGRSHLFDPNYSTGSAFGATSSGIDDGPDVEWVNELLM
ncbi:unnamed protein product [Rhodiola kirilowii]